MEHLPELPFELILSHLSLKDRLKARAVSRSWYHKIDSFRVKSLCYSQRPSGFIYGKERLVSGAFARNFISSTRFASFFDTFGRTLLSNLKHLRLCDLNIERTIDEIAFISSLSSFGRLEELDLIRFNGSGMVMFQLNLLALQSIRLEKLRGIEQLTLNAPRLKKVKLVDCDYLRLSLVHLDSVESVNEKFPIGINKWKNLKHLHIQNCRTIGSTFLISMKRLQEIHLENRDNLQQLFQLKRQQKRTDLKIFYCGLLLDGPDVPMSSGLDCFSEDAFVHLAENPSRLADEIPFYRRLDYAGIERVAPGSEMNVLKRFTDLTIFNVSKPVQDIERFLVLLKNFDSISELKFLCDQPQELFDRLPEYCAVQRLKICRPVSDLKFLLRLKNLTHFDVDRTPQNDADSATKFVRSVFKELQFVSFFKFQINNKLFKIEIDDQNRIYIAHDGNIANAIDLDSSITFINRKALA